MAHRSVVDILAEVTAPPDAGSQPLPRLVPTRLMREGWRRRASCRGLTELFFSSVPEHVEEALSICSRCPVIFECGHSAEANSEEHGVWGGTTEKERGADSEPLAG